MYHSSKSNNCHNKLVILCYFIIFTGFLGTQMMSVLKKDQLVTHSLVSKQ